MLMQVSGMAVKAIREGAGMVKTRLVKGSLNLWPLYRKR
jgi:hypothetical protein